MTAEPTLAEVARRLDEISMRLLDLTNQLRTDYLRADLYLAQRQADRDDVDDLKRRFNDSEKQRAADRRMLFVAIVAPIVVALVSLYVAAKFGGHTA